MSSIIRLHNREIALTAVDVYSIDDGVTSLPPESISFMGPDNSPLFWLVKVEYEALSETVTLHVVNYETTVEHQLAFRTERLRRPVRHICFRPLDELRLRPYTIRFNRELLSPHLILAPAPDQPTTLPASPAPPLTIAQLHRLGRVWNGLDLITYPLTWTDRFRSRFDEATFEAGKLTGWRDKVPLGRPRLRFEIYNEHLRPEYAYICSFITRQLKRETFDVHLTVTEYADGSCAGVATSPQVAQIDATLIDSFRTTRAQQVRQRPEGPINGKQTYTLDEVLTLTREPGEPAGLLTTAELQHRLITDARNRTQIEYLAANKQDTDAAVRFTFGHYVGFIFCILGTAQRHYCWELLNSHATYVWSFPRAMSAADALSRLETQLQRVNQSGRTEYRRLGVQPAAGAQFAFVEHTLLNKSEGETFARWRQEVDNLLG
jgi:hypothetical protein